MMYIYLRTNIVGREKSIATQVLDAIARLEAMVPVDTSQVHRTFAFKDGSQDMVLELAFRRILPEDFELVDDFSRTLLAPIQTVILVEASLTKEEGACLYDILSAMDGRTELAINQEGIVLTVTNRTSFARRLLMSA